MSTITVWRFPSPYGADSVRYELEELEKQGLIKVHDAVAVTWEVSATKPTARSLKGRGGAIAKDSVLGLLFGLTFAVPVVGLAVGAAVGAKTAAGVLAKAGVDQDFLQTLRDKVTPGTSALVVMTSDAVMDRVREAFARQDMELISTNLSADQEAALRQAVGD